MNIECFACLVEENSGGLMYVRNYLSAAHAKLNFHHGSVQPRALLDIARSQVIKYLRNTKPFFLAALMH